MAKMTSKQLPDDFINPFKGRNPDEVWKELMKNAKPISKDEEADIIANAKSLQKESDNEKN